MRKARSERIGGQAAADGIHPVPRHCSIGRLGFHDEETIDRSAPTHFPCSIDVPPDLMPTWDLQMETLKATTQESQDQQQMDPLLALGEVRSQPIPMLHTAARLVQASLFCNAADAGSRSFSSRPSITRTNSLVIGRDACLQRVAVRVG